VCAELILPDDRQEGPECRLAEEQSAPDCRRQVQGMNPRCIFVQEHGKYELEHHAAATRLLQTGSTVTARMRGLHRYGGQLRLRTRAWWQDVSEGWWT
jgi:hypothetical protein